MHAYYQTWQSVVERRIHMRDKVITVTLMIFLSPLWAGCVRAISKDLRAQVDENVSVGHALKNPDPSIQKTVMWGGVIVDAKNLKEGTLFEIVQKPISFEGRPRDVDQSEGRFLALYEGYLDVAIFSSGREVTVAGPLTRLKKKRLGEIEYTYPMVVAKEIYLWSKRTEEKHYYYPYWYGPRYRGDPWYW
jgi:outer membrane lipoprotein